MDTDASGGLDIRELRVEMKEQGEYVDEESLRKLFRDIDSNQDGHISFDEADEHEDANP
jgi:Ca2+-binding EF-hand superfamily protein